MIEVKEITKGFFQKNNYNEVIHNMSFVVSIGEFVTIMGPSGSGKSTLLYTMSGMLKPEKGQIIIDNKEINLLKNSEISEMRKNQIGFIFQDNKLLPELTVYENVFLATRIAKNKNNVEEILEMVDMLEFKDYKAQDLSGGMAQRVNIARALINNPIIIFADEPTGSLDSTSSKKIMELLQKINREKKKTIVMVTHQYENALYGQRLLTIQDGRLIKDEKI